MLVTAAAAVARHASPLRLWDQWDARWYLGIALHGYHWSLDGKPAVAFFPLYPLLVRVITGLGLADEVSGLLLSSLCFAGASFYLYHLVRAEHGPQAARRALWLLAFFPTALFTFAPYTEALLLLCAVAAFYHARRQQPLLAGFWLAAAVLTRSTGIILLPAVLVALGHGRARRADPRRLGVAAALALPGLALAAYGWYLGLNGLSLNAVLSAERAWHRSLTAPWTGFLASLSWLAQHGAARLDWAAENSLQLAVTMLFLLLTVAAWRSLRLDARLYCLGFWALVLLTPEWLDGYYAPFSSMDRFVLALFPLAGWAAVRLSPLRFRLLLVGSAAALAAAAAVHLAGGWVG